MAILLAVEGYAISEWRQADDTVSTLAEYGLAPWRQQRALAEIYRLADCPLTKQVLVERFAQQMTISYEAGTCWFRSAM